MSRLIRIYHKQEGVHVHCRVFTGKGPELTLAKAGDLIFDTDTFPEYQKLLFQIEWIEEGKTRYDPCV